MTVEQILKDRGINELVHFTTSTGLLGILSTQSLLPRSHLAAEQALEYILKHNAPFRSDPSWLRYINLSITKINQVFFDHSGRLHRDSGVFWVVLAIDPKVMCHDGVYFATTNNIYPACRRGEDSQALERLFAQRVSGRYSVPIIRPAEHPDNWTTCPQAEVLYPGRLSAQFIRNIYVRSDTDRNSVNAQIAALGVAPYEIIVEPERFAYPAGALV